MWKIYVAYNITLWYNPIRWFKASELYFQQVLFLQALWARRLCIENCRFQRQCYKGAFQNFPDNFTILVKYKFRRLLVNLHNMVIEGLLKFFSPVVKPDSGQKEGSVSGVWLVIIFLKIAFEYESSKKLLPSPLSCFS